MSEGLDIPISTPGAPAAAESLGKVADALDRVAQVLRHRAQTDLGATVGDVRHAVVEGLTVNDYVAAMASLRTRHE